MGKPRSAAGRARVTNERLKDEYPDAICALTHDNPFQLLVATILSAQCTDEMVNKATPGLFAVYPDAYALATATPLEIEPLIQTLGLFRSKARNLAGMAAALVARTAGRHPRRAHQPPARPHRGNRRGEGRIRAGGDAAARGLGRLLVADDPARPSDLHRQPAQVRTVRPVRLLSERPLTSFVRRRTLATSERSTS
jgi:hypothetical protein